MGCTSFDPRWRVIHEDGTLFPGDQHPAMVTLRTGQPCIDVVMGVQRPNGELSWLTVNSQPMFLEGQAQPCAVVCSFADITERKQAEEALRAAEERFRTLVEQLLVKSQASNRELWETITAPIRRPSCPGYGGER